MGNHGESWTALSGASCRRGESNAKVGLHNDGALPRALHAKGRPPSTPRHAYVYHRSNHHHHTKRSRTASTIQQGMHRDNRRRGTRDKTRPLTAQLRWHTPKPTLSASTTSPALKRQYAASIVTATAAAVPGSAGRRVALGLGREASMATPYFLGFRGTTARMTVCRWCLMNVRDGLNSQFHTRPSRW